MSDIAAVGQTIAVAAQALADNMETAWDNDRKDAYLKGYSCVQMAVIVAGSLRASGWQSPDQIAALTSRAEAAECQLAAVQKLYGDKSEQYLAERRRTDAAEAQVAACRGYVQDWDDSKKAAVDVIAKIRAVTASSLPASPATEKLQARTDESGWLIEAAESEPSRPLYWAGSFGDERDRWTYDNLKAVRLARKDDADAVAREVLDGYAVRIAEHGWSSP